MRRPGTRSGKASSRPMHRSRLVRLQRLHLNAQSPAETARRRISTRYSATPSQRPRRFPQSRWDIDSPHEPPPCRRYAPGFRPLTPDRRCRIRIARSPIALRCRPSGNAPAEIPGPAPGWSAPASPFPRLVPPWPLGQGRSPRRNKRTRSRAAPRSRAGHW